MNVEYGFRLVDDMLNELGADMAIMILSRCGIPVVAHVEREEDMDHLAGDDEEDEEWLPPDDVIADVRLS